MRTTNTIKVNGIGYVPVKVECMITPGVGIHLVGLSDLMVKESLLRTVTAMQAVGYRIPGKKIVVNFAPADLVKSGSAYDLALALSIIAESGQTEIRNLENMLLVGELGLDGSVRGVPGVVQAVQAAVDNGLTAIIPEDNVAEVADLFGEDARVFPVSTLIEAIEVASTGMGDTVWDIMERDGVDEDVRRCWWDEIVGQFGAKRAMEIAAAGGHNMMIMGHTGTGKAWLAKAMLDILPPMSREETLEVAKVYSAAGKGMKRGRPFRAPHSAASMSAMFGGGAGAFLMPGEVSLADRGVLYLGAFPEVPKAVKDCLRGPLEDGKIVLSRLKSRVEYPAHFQLVLGSEPCPCGYYGEGDRCTCTKSQRQAYLSHLSGPVFDAVDVQVWVHALPENAEVTGDPASVVAERVAKARAMQMARQGKLNAELRWSEVQEPTDECKVLLERLVDHLSLSARAYTRILRIARTIADLAGSEEIRPEHIAEASSFRFLDRVEL